jgi:hypothetical protein
VNDKKTELDSPVELSLLNTDDVDAHALERYTGFLKELSEMPVEQLSNADFTADELSKLGQYVGKVDEWLGKCRKDAGYGSQLVYSYSTAINYDMYRLRNLLKTVYERKVVKEREASERKAEKERQQAQENRRKAALREMSPPFDDAQKYLSDEERNRFLDSLCGAADAYLDGGKGCPLNDWLLDQRAGGYLLWTHTVEKRKREEARYKQAELEHSHFLKEINDTTKGFKQQLAKEKKPNFAYPLPLAEYHPDLWCELELPTREEVEKWARPQIQQKVPSVLRGFVVWDLGWWVQRLPEAKYEVLGVPCLTWSFLLKVLVKVHLRLVEKRFTNEFCGYQYDLMTVPEELGSFYLGPVDWVEREGFSTPIVVLSLLSDGKLESDGIEIVEHERSSTILHLRGYDDEFVEVKEHFRNFIVDLAKEKGLAQGLLAKGVIDGLTARLVEEKAKLSLPPVSGPEPSSEESTDDVISALEAMGYKKGEIKAAIKAAQFSPGMSLEEKVKAVLKILGT